MIAAALLVGLSFGIVLGGIIREWWGELLELDDPGAWRSAADAGRRCQQGTRRFP